MNIFRFIEAIRQSRIEAIERAKMRHVGTCLGRTKWIDKDGDEQSSFAYYIMRENLNGDRDYEQIGTRGDSQHCRKCYVQVKAWASGGPLPDDHFFDTKYYHPSEPKRKKADLIVFPGGRAGE